MFDLRDKKVIDLDISDCLKQDVTYKFIDSTTGKELVSKFITYYDDSDDIYLITEFRKLILLSGEPEIGTVYFLCTGQLGDKTQSCYVMDFIKGKTLQEYLDSRESLIYEVIYDILIQLSSGLEKSHNFDVYHSDLHNENIIINEFGFLKIIDYLWMDYNLSNSTKQKTDLEDFKRISNELFEKCCDRDKGRFHYINTYCQKITTFKGLKQELKLLNEISFELSLMESRFIDILLKLFESTGTVNQLNRILIIEEDEIPEEFIPPLTDREEFFLEKNTNGSHRLKYDDTKKVSSIYDTLFKIFDSKLFTLKQSNLIDWNMNVTNTGVTFVGPYKLRVDILPTSKFFKFKRTREMIELIHPINEISLHELIYEKQI